MARTVRKVIEGKKRDQGFWEFVMILRDTKTGKHSAFHFYEPKGTTLKEVREKLHPKDETTIIIDIERFHAGKKERIARRIVNLDERYAEKQK